MYNTNDRDKTPGQQKNTTKKRINPVKRNWNKTVEPQVRRGSKNIRTHREGTTGRKRQG